MTREEWYKEYQKWRSFFRMNFLQTVGRYKTYHDEAHTMANSIKCDAVREMAHPAIYYALFNRDYTSRVRLVTEGKWAIKCNMDLSPQQIEDHRLNSRC